MPVTVQRRDLLTEAQRKQCESEALAVIESTRYGGASPYRNHIILMERWSGDKDTGAQTFSIRPYFETAGRVAEANDDRARPIIGIRTFLNPGDQPMKAEYRGESYLVPAGHAKAVLARWVQRGDEWFEQTFEATEAIRSGGSGADRTHPLANAETSAVGRVLGFAGFGVVPGSSLSPAETMAATPQDDAVPSAEAPKPSAARRTRSAEKAVELAGDELAPDELETLLPIMKLIVDAETPEALKIAGQQVQQAMSSAQTPENQRAYLQALYVQRRTELKNKATAEAEALDHAADGDGAASDAA